MAPFSLNPKRRDVSRSVWRVMFRNLRLHYRLNSAVIEQLHLDTLLYGRCWYVTELKDIRQFLPKAPAEQVGIVRRIERPDGPTID